MRVLRRFVAPAAALAVVACGGGDLSLPSDGGGDGGGPGPSASLSTVSADPASIPAGTGASTITVTVRDTANNPIGGAIVALQATGSDNTLTQPAGTTGADGTATGTLRSTVPGTTTISATVNGTMHVSQTAQVTITPAPASRIELVEGDNQSAPVGTNVLVPPAVKVTGDAGQPLVGIGVTFVVTGGGGSVVDAEQTTNSDGIARVGAWTLGATPGTNTLEARAGSIQGSPVVFSAEATSSSGVDHFVFRVQPHDVHKGEMFPVEVAMVDAAGDVVPLSGIEIHLGLFKDGSDVSSNKRLLGDRFQDTQSGVAAFDLGVSEKGRYRLRALADALPAVGPAFSDLFEVK